MWRQKDWTLRINARTFTNFKITKMARYAKEIDVVDESDEEIERVLQENVFL